MKIRQILITSQQLPDLSTLAEIEPQLVLVFGSTRMLQQSDLFAKLSGAVPDAIIAGCSTAGEITNKGVSHESLSLTALRFDKVRLKAARATLLGMEHSAQAGREIAQKLAADDLTALLLFAKGLDINGSALIDGIKDIIGCKIPISGGLAGDDIEFKKTLTITHEGIESDAVIGIGFYGKELRVAHSCFGGWSPFGPPRKVTRSSGSILYELDGHPALELYRQYLGEYAKDLPSSGLLFPFEMLDADHSSLGLIRTILGIDDEAGSLILAGDILPDGFLRLMHSSNDKLVDGAELAGMRLRESLGGNPGNGVAILISCVGRKIVMGDAVEEEVEVIAKVLPGVTLTGFYSYGEISPFGAIMECKLHNQTMTAIYLGED